MEDWNTGRLEYWNRNEVKPEMSIVYGLTSIVFPFFHHSIFPSFHLSNRLRHSRIPTYTEITTPKGHEFLNLIKYQKHRYNLNR
jgi:hypothetical protein